MNSKLSQESSSNSIDKERETFERDGLLGFSYLYMVSSSFAFASYLTLPLLHSPIPEPFFFLLPSLFQWSSGSRLASIISFCRQLRTTRQLLSAKQFGQGGDSVQFPRITFNCSFLFLSPLSAPVSLPFFQCCFFSCSFWYNSIRKLS